MSTRQKQVSGSQPDILTLSFNGPMFFDFASRKRNGMVDVYTPRCPYHQGAFFFSNNSYSEMDLYQKASREQPGLARAYVIAIADREETKRLPGPIVPTPPSQNLRIVTAKPDSRWTPKGGGDPQVIRILTIDGAGRKDLHLNRSLFKVSVPTPDSISTLYTATVTVKTSEPRGGGMDAQEYATGIRFFYKWAPAAAVTLKVAPLGESFVRDATPPRYPGLPQLGDLEIRYEGIGLEDQNDPHSDARACFGSLTGLVGKNWWLDFGDGLTGPASRVGSTGKVPAKTREPGKLFIKTGQDCHAPVVTAGLELG